MKNLLIRTASAIVFLGIMLAALLWCPQAFGVIFSLIVLIMMNEYLTVTMKGRHPLAQFFSILAGVLLFFLTYLIMCYSIDVKWLLLIPLLLVAIFVTILYDRERQSYLSYPFLLTAILYIALPFTMLHLISFDMLTGAFNGKVVLSLMIILWSGDVGAYIFGMTFGQKNGHKLFPSISPHKSWEGFFGGLLLAILAGFLLHYWGMMHYGLVHSLIIALLIYSFGTLGDLAESQLKRHFGVKDAGNIMPGHGGLLDRFDGALLAFPVAVSYILLLGL